MKKILFVLIVVAILIAGITIANAKSPNAAIILHHKDSCLLPDASGDFTFQNLWPVPSCSHCLATNSKTGTKICVFTGKLPEGALLPEKPVHFTYETSAPFVCWFSPTGPWSDQYVFTITPNGQVSGHCIFKDE